MEVRVTRKTGFYGMGSPIKVILNDKTFMLNHEQSKTLTITEETCSIQVSFYLLKSKVYRFQPQKEPLDLIIQMNPKMIQIYLILFGFMLLMPLLLRSIAVSILLIVLFIGFLLKFLHQAYIVKENGHGTTS